MVYARLHICHIHGLTIPTNKSIKPLPRVTSENYFLLCISFAPVLLAPSKVQRCRAVKVPGPDRSDLARAHVHLPGMAQV